MYIYIYILINLFMYICSAAAHPRSTAPCHPLRRLGQLARPLNISLTIYIHAAVLVSRCYDTILKYSITCLTIS